jgi:hypothetical protein
MTYARHIALAVLAILTGVGIAFALPHPAKIGITDMQPRIITGERVRRKMPPTYRNDMSHHEYVAAHFQTLGQPVQGLPKMTDLPWRALPWASGFSMIPVR